MSDAVVRGRGASTPLDVVLVGAGERAREWWALIERSSRLRLTATVARGEGLGSASIKTYRLLGDAVAGEPTASFAVALPPRAATDAARELAVAGRNAVVEAPLHDGVLDLDCAEVGDSVRVAHGWVTMAGRGVVAQVIDKMRAGRISVDIAGLPEAEQGEVGECLVHGLALVRALRPAAAVIAAEPAADGLQVRLSDGGWDVDLRLRRRGGWFAVRIDGAGANVVWEWRNGVERVAAGARELLPSRPSPVGSMRALAQLLPDVARGDGLDAAVAVLRLARQVADRCSMPPSGRLLRQAASIARRRPDDVLGRLGLCGALAETPGVLPEPLAVRLPTEPFELWAFRAGLKPVVFLTVRPQEVAAVRAHFGDDVHCEVRQRRVSIVAQDRWRDRRDEGEERVELYISRSADLAERAARLQAEGDPTHSLQELGELVGYPPCCVAAFAAQDDRANNSLNRYHSRARTPAAAGGGATTWPWQLNNLHTMIAPFYPCSYRCAAALQWTRGALIELGRVHPAAVEDLRRALSRPVLYFDHDHQLVFDGSAVAGAIDYRGVSPVGVVSGEMALLTAAIAAGNHLCLDDAVLAIERDGRSLLRLRRTDPALGFIAPFADEERSRRVSGG